MTARKEHPVKATGWRMALAFAAILCGCAATVPTELVDARLAYKHASEGPAAQLVPADLHTAHEALIRAEESFDEDGNSYQTLDLAYVAQRRAEMATVLASIAKEKKNKTGSDSVYKATQDNLLQARSDDLIRTRTALAEAKQSGEAIADQLSAERQARAGAEQQRLEAERQRVESEQQTDDALAALAKLAAVKEDERGLIITLSGSVLFRSGEATLMAGAQTQLDRVAEALLSSSSRNLLVEGFTDSQGSDQYNLELSQRRADAVREYLVQKGYPAGGIQARGIGEGRPIADNATSEGRANNRRVELVLERLARM